MGALKSFVELKRSGEDEIEQKESLLRKFDLLKARRMCRQQTKSCVGFRGVYKCCEDWSEIFINLIFQKPLLKAYLISASLFTFVAFSGKKYS
jgi:hypothetical protein